MKKILSNKKILIIICIVVILIIILTIIFLSKTSDEIALTTHVKHDVVEELYKEVENNVEEGTKQYVSKLYGYSYDEEGNIVMQVREGYIENNKVYDLEGNELGDYTEEELNSILDKATLKTYNYTKENNNYKLNE